MTNQQKFQAQWDRVHGQIKQKWGKLTEEEITQINGQREKLINQLQVKYGFAKEQAEKELTAFEKKVLK